MVTAKAAGLKTTLMFGPLLPQISDTPEGLRRLFDLAAEVRPDRIWTDALNDRPRVWPALQQFLGCHRPELVEHYRRVLFDPEARAQYLQDLHQRIQQAADEAGVGERLG
jgi:DNA repair photolyase